MKTTRNSLIILALSATTLTGIAHAQAPAAGAPGADAGTATITNETTTDTTLTVGEPTAAFDGVEGGEPTEAGDALPDTGGEPWLFALGGIALASGALALRRKLA